MKAIVTDANNRIALAVARSLGSRGIDIICVEQEQFSKKTPLCFYSKYCKKGYVLPNLHSAGDKFVAGILNIASNGDVLIPVSTGMVDFVSSQATELGKFINFVVPSQESFVLANDKEAVINLADTIGIPTPKTILVKSGGQLKEIAGNIGYPVVIKIRNDSGINLKPGEKYRIAKNSKELINFCDLLKGITSDFVIQEYIKGQGYGFEAFFDANNELKAYFCHRRLREYPISGGPSSFCESVNDPQLIDYGLKLLSKMSWKGLAMVEFKKDVIDNKFKLIEVNPKFWGTLPLAIESGIDFPFIFYNASLGNKLEIKKEYPAGIKMRFLWLDIPAVIQELLKGKRKLFTLRSLLKELFNFRIKDGLLSIDDIKPGIMYLIQRLEK